QQREHDERGVQAHLGTPGATDGPVHADPFICLNPAIVVLIGEASIHQAGRDCHLPPSDAFFPGFASGVADASSPWSPSSDSISPSSALEHTPSTTASSQPSAAT